MQDSDVSIPFTPAPIDGRLPKSDVVNMPVMYDEKTEQVCHTVEDFENFSTVSTFKLL